MKDFILNLALPLAVLTSVLYPLFKGMGWHHYLSMVFLMQAAGNFVIYITTGLVFGLIYWFIRETAYKAKNRHGSK